MLFSSVGLVLLFASFTFAEASSSGQTSIQSKTYANLYHQSFYSCLPLSVDRIPRGAKGVTQLAVRKKIDAVIAKYSREVESYSGKKMVACYGY